MTGSVLASQTAIYTQAAAVVAGFGPLVWILAGLVLAGIFIPFFLGLRGSGARPAAAGRHAAGAPSAGSGTAIGASAGRGRKGRPRPTLASKYENRMRALWVRLTQGTGTPEQSITAERARILKLRTDSEAVGWGSPGGIAPGVRANDSYQSSGTVGAAKKRSA